MRVICSRRGWPSTPSPTTSDPLSARRVGSTSNQTASGGRQITSSCRRDAKVGRVVSTALVTMVSSATRSLRRVIFPDVMRETSRRSSTRRTMWRTCRWMRSRACSTMAVSAERRCRSSSALHMGARGFRSSCASIARNSSLRRSAAASCCARWRSSSSRRFRSVMSIPTPIMRTGRPPASGSTRPFPAIQRTAPSGASVRNSMSSPVRFSTARAFAWSTAVRSSGWTRSRKAAKVPPKLPGASPWMGSRFSDHRSAPLVRSQSQTPMRPASRASRNPSSLSSSCA